MDQEIVIRFLLAIIWGGIIGAEREYRSKSAGFRTMIMISLGACFFTILSKLIGAPNNADRIASNIVSGIGFLGAGVIYRGDNRVNGITTAATIWVVAAVGMGIGAGYYVASAFGSLSIILILALLPYIERYIDSLNQAKTYSIHLLYHEDIIEKYEQLFRQCHLRFHLSALKKIGTVLTIEWQVQGHKKNHRQLSRMIMEQNDVIEFTS